MQTKPIKSVNTFNLRSEHAMIRLIAHFTP